MVKENGVTLSLPKGMKQTEIGLLPEDWGIDFLHTITDLVTDGAHLSPPTSRYGFPIVTVENINKGYINFASCRIISEKDYLYLVRNNCKPINGDVLLSKDGTIGITFTIKDNPNIVLLSSIALIRPNKTLLNSEYLSQILSSHWFYIYLNRVQGGSALTRIVLRDIKNFYLALPPLPEQEVIAEALSDVDAWIESLEKLIAKKKLVKQGAMQKLLKPKEGWELRKLGEVIDVYRGGSPRPIQNFITDKLDGINWIKIGDTSSYGKYIISANEKIIAEGEKNSRRVYKGDFLLSNSMSFGRPYILKIDGCIHDGWLVLQNYKAFFETEFLYYLLTSKYIIDQYKSKAAGSSVLNLNKELVSTVELIIPPLTEQTRIATILSDMDAELEALATQLEKAKKIKQGMMQELLTGRIRLV